MALDLALAIERLRPGARYLQSTDGQSIVEWRDPRVQPTTVELQTASDAALAELAAAKSADSNERAALRAIYVALRDGTGTAGERLQRLEQVVAWLMRREALNS